MFPCQMRRKLGIVNIEDLALDFTIPGYDIELRVRVIFRPGTIYSHNYGLAWRL